MKNQKSIELKIDIMLAIIMIAVLIFSSVIFIFNMKASLKKEAQTKIKDIDDIAWQTIMDYKNAADSGLMSEEEAKKAAVNAIAQFRYQDKSNYVWINDYDVKMLVNPTKKIGEDCSNVTDPDGIAFYRNLTNDAKKDGSATASYKWVKAGQAKNKYYPKTSVARNVEGWNWIVATGVYLDEIDNIVNTTMVVVIIVNLILAVIINLTVKFLFSKKLAASLNGSSNTIVTNLNTTTKATNDLDYLSQQLAESSNEQAASVQEIAATVEETASMVKKNDENTKYAASLTRQANENTEASFNQMQELTSAMAKIDESSQEISKIIKVIDEIAFQTNILALNAAVEAARAGDAGKGFAVVAEEVRNLAQKSTESAKDTTSLIENNIALCQESDEIVKRVNDSITQIRHDVNSVDKIIQEVAVATHEQQIGVEQISAAMSQIEKALYNNSQSANQTATLSRELSGLTESFNEAASDLDVTINGSNK